MRIGLFALLLIATNLFADSTTNVEILAKSTKLGLKAIAFDPRDLNKNNEKFVVAIAAHYYASGNAPGPLSVKGVITRGIPHALTRLGAVGLGVSVGSLVYEIDKKYLGESLPTTKLGHALGRITYNLFHKDKKINQSQRHSIKDADEKFEESAIKTKLATTVNEE